MNNKTNNSVKLTTLIEEFSFVKLYVPDSIDSVMITRSEIDRPGLQLTGFFDYFSPERIQILGRVESIYLSQLSNEERYKRLNDYLEKKPVCLIFARDIEPPSEIYEIAKRFEVPILGTHLSTTNIISAMIASLNIHLAPTITRSRIVAMSFCEPRSWGNMFLRPLGPPTSCILCCFSTSVYETAIKSCS